jgi:hypothetical protein
MESESKRVLGYGLVLPSAICSIAIFAVVGVHIVPFGLLVVWPILVLPAIEHNAPLFWTVSAMAFLLIAAVFVFIGRKTKLLDKYPLLGPSAAVCLAVLGYGIIGFLVVLMSTT